MGLKGEVRRELGRKDRKQVWLQCPSPGSETVNTWLGDAGPVILPFMSLQ